MSAFSKSLSVLCAIANLGASLARAAPCAFELVPESEYPRVIAESLQAELQTLPWPERALLARVQKSVTERVAEFCRNTEDCTEARITEAVQAALRDLKAERLSGARGYALLTSALVGLTWGAAELSSRIPQDYKALSMIVGTVTTLILVSVGAPIFEPISAKLRQWFFKVNEDPTPNASLNRNKHLNRLWKRTQETFSVNEQMSRNVIQSFLIGMESTLAMHALEKQETDGAARAIASVLLRKISLFPDLPPQQALVRQSIQAWLGERSEDSRAALLALAWERFKAMAASASIDIDEAETQRTLAYWIR